MRHYLRYERGRGFLTGELLLRSVRRGRRPSGAPSRAVYGCLARPSDDERGQQFLESWSPRSLPPLAEGEARGTKGAAPRDPEGVAMPHREPQAETAIDCVYDSVTAS